MPKALKNMTDDELTEANQKLMQEVDDIRTQQRTINEEMNKREAQKKLEAMTDSEKSALAQVITDAGGIESLESASTPSTTSEGGES